MVGRTFGTTSLFHLVVVCVLGGGVGVGCLTSVSTIFWVHLYLSMNSVRTQYKLVFHPFLSVNYMALVTLSMSALSLF